MILKFNRAILFFSCILFTAGVATAQGNSVSSPDKNIRITIWLNNWGQPRYEITYRNRLLLKESSLGVIREDEDLSKDFKDMVASKITAVKDTYVLQAGKKSTAQYGANKRQFYLKKGNGKQLAVTFQVSNDGVAFRYGYPGIQGDGRMIKEEMTSFHFDTSARGYLQPMQTAKSGWEKTNPAYEEHYQQNIPVTTPSPTGAGWVYPALFNDKNDWILITEAALDTNDCATRLQSSTSDGEYRIGFPDAREVLQENGLLPKVVQKAGGSASPWRILTIGNLKTIIESTLGTDLAKPSIKMDLTAIKPGKASWSWIMSKDDSIVYTEQVRYIDLAAKMNWQYCLVDAAWDQKIGYEKINELSKYASSKNVGLLLWYNSAGDWNTVKYTPKNKLLTQESRMKEFSLLKEMGIKGVKIDFFGGDGQSVIKYYINILNDAAKFGLLVNFHGATLPRGWHRTYPHLLTTEAVRGFEMITFNQQDADAAANHCAMLPFARNAFDPMDFTPMNLSYIPTSVKRRTTPAFELATSVLFLSGIQHYAESPAGMQGVPPYVQQFLRELPNSWDDVQFIEGFPGKYVVLARKAGKKWYIAGINGEKVDRTIQLKLSPFHMKKASLITDGNEPNSFWQEKLTSAGEKSLLLKANGGFVIVLE